MEENDKKMKEAQRKLVCAIVLFCLFVLFISKLQMSD